MKPKLVFKKNLVFFLGQHSYDVDPPRTGGYEVIKPESLLDLEASRFDMVSFNKIPMSGVPMTLEFRSLDTSTLGKHTGQMFARYDTTMESFEFEYEVVDGKNILIETDHLLIRKIMASDLPQIYEWLNRETIERFHVMRPINYEFYAQELETYRGDYYYLDVKASEAIVGQLHLFPDPNRGAVGAGALSFWMGDVDDANLYLQEALEAFIPLAFTEFYYDFLTARIKSTDRDSQRIMEDLGFVQEGYLQRAGSTMSGALYDDILYILFK